MIHRTAADLVLVLHLLFVLFVVVGGFLVLKWPKLAWLHLPAAIWGVLIEFFGWICPLTPMENHLRRLGGEAGYEGGFVEHYIVAVLYPSGLTRWMQLGLGVLVLVVNVAVYGRLLRRRRNGPGEALRE